MSSRKILVEWIDMNNSKGANNRELAQLHKLEPLYDIIVHSSIQPLSTLDNKFDYILLLSSEVFKVQSDMLKGKLYNLLGIIIYCHNVKDHKRFQNEKYVMLVTNDFKEVEKKVLALAGELEFEAETDERGYRVAGVEEEENRFVVFGKEKMQTPEFFNPEDYERRKRNILELFRLDLDVQKDFEKTKKTLEEELKKLFKEKGVLALEKEFLKISQAKTMQELVRVCVYFYSLEKSNIYTSLNVILKNLRLIRFQTEFAKLKLFAFLFLLNYFFFYSQSEYISTVYRYTDYVPVEFVESSTITVCNFYSTSKKSDLPIFKNKKTKITIETFDHSNSSARKSMAFFNYLSASKFSAFKQEEEVIFAPFTRFKVCKVDIKEPQNQVFLREMGSNVFLQRIYDMNLLEKNQEVKEKFDRQLNYQMKYEKLLNSKNQTNTRQMAKIYSNLGTIYGSSNQYKWAMDYFKRSLDIYTLLKDQFQISTVINNMGLISSKIGKKSEALAYYQKALEVRKRLEGDKSRSLVSIINNIGSLREEEGKIEQALALYNEALFICQLTYPQNHPMRATLLNNIGYTLVQSNKLAEALARFQIAIEIYQNVEGQASANIVICYENMADIYQKMGDIPKCEEYYSKAIEMEMQVKGRLSANLHSMYCSKGRLYNKRGEYEKAKQCYEKGLEVCTACYGPNHNQTALMYNNLGSLEESLGNPEQALIYFQRALDLLYLVYRENNKDIIQTVSANVADLKEKLQDGFFKP